MEHHRRLRVLAGCLLALSIAATPAAGDTIEAAMAAALARHPQVRAEEARAAAARAGIDAARAGYHPRIAATADVGFTTGMRGLDGGPVASTSDGGQWGYALTARQPLFDGWRTASAVGEAVALHGSQTSLVVSVVEASLLEAATAYLDLQRDQRIEALRARELGDIEAVLAAARERMARGVGTETDVAQARARRAQGLADVIHSRAGAAASRVAFTRIVGRAPDRLTPATLPADRLPRTLAAAFARAEADNAEPRTADLRAEAQRYAGDRANAEQWPQVTLDGRVGGQRALSSDLAADHRDDAAVSLRLTAPLYDGGEAQARARQAAALRLAHQEEARAARERIKASVEIAWQRVAAGRERLAAEQMGVTAAEAAAQGIAEEVRQGTRTTLDLLDAQRELIASRIRVAATERDLAVAGYGLLAAMGALAGAVESVRIAPRESPVTRAAARGDRTTAGAATERGATWAAAVRPAGR